MKISKQILQETLKQLLPLTLAWRLVIAALLVTTAASPATAAPVVLAPASEPVAAVQAEDGAQADQSPQAAQTAQEDDAAVAGEAAQETGDVTYRLGDAVIDPEMGAQLVGRRVYIVVRVLAPEEMSPIAQDLSELCRDLNAESPDESVASLWRCPSS